MAYDEDLANRIRELVGGQSGVTEKKMFGGLSFLIGGHMAVSASGQGGVLVRVEPAQSEELVFSTNAVNAEMRGRLMEGWLRVGSEHLRTPTSARQVGPPRHRLRPLTAGKTIGVTSAVGLDE